MVLKQSDLLTGYQLRFVKEVIDLYTGKFVVFFEHKEIILGICLEEQANRIVVLCEDRNKKKLNKSRVIHSSADRADLQLPRQELLNLIRRRSVSQQDCAQQVRPVELWKAVSSNSSLYSLKTLAEIVFGDIAHYDHEIAVLRVLIQDRIHFKLKGSHFLAHTPEQVAKLTSLAEKELQKQREIKEASAWLCSVVHAQELPCAHRDKFIELLKKFVIFGSKTPRYKDIKCILASAGITDQKACFDVLVKLGSWDEDENILLDKYQVPHRWTDSVTEQTVQLRESLVQQALDDPCRNDLTNLRVFSIDEPFTKDIDDAISFNFHDSFFELGIHITDVASFVLPGTPLDKEAARRGASLYLPEGKIPMLPHAISEDLLSLKAHEIRPAISVFIKLSLTGEILDFKWVLSTIKVSAKLSYAEVDRKIEEDEDFSRLYMLTSLLRKRRISGGATWVLIPELQVRIGPHKEIITTMRDRETPSQMLVSECMIITNYCTALFFKQKNYPALYRRQAAPSQMIEPGSTPSLFQLFMQSKKFSRVEIDSIPGPHSSLGLASYTSITSPLRKYFDLITQRQLVSLIREAESFYGRKQLKDMAASLQSVLTRVAIVEQERKRYWALKVLATRVGETLEGFIINTSFRWYTILLLEYLLEVPCKAPERTSLYKGDAVSVRVDFVEPFAGKVRLRLVA